MSRILLIEDDQWLGELYAQLLGREHDLTWLRDGYDAMESIEAKRPDVIVLDVLLPWTSGVQILHELASYADTATIPVVLFTSALPEGISSDALRAYGVVVALDKSTVKPHEVLKTINTVVVGTYANN